MANFPMQWLSAWYRRQNSRSSSGETVRWGVVDMVWRQRHKKTGAKEPLLRCGTPDQILTGGLPLRRRSLYTTELRGRIGDMQMVRCTVRFLQGYTRFFYFTCFSSPCQSGGRPPQKNREPLFQRLPAEGAFAAYSITRTRMTLGRCLTSSMTLSATLEPRSTIV